MRFVLQPVRIPFAVGAGAMVGAAGVTAGYSLPLLDPDALQMVLGMAPLIFVVALMVWAFGLFVIGGPVWVVLHSRNRTRPADALAAGAVTTFLVALLFSLLMTASLVSERQGGYALVEDGQRTAFGWLMLLGGCALLSTLGGLVGLVIWRVAYRAER